jgi:DNA-binding NarL/FixJ family response regulator
MDTAIQNAQEKMIFVTNDKEKLRAYQMRMLALSDQVSGIKYARREGRRERDSELVKRQVAKGRSNEDIADFMGISVMQVQKIRQAN